MNVLVVGNGGREHALAWSLLRSPNVERVICVPGNGGTATLDGCENRPIAVDDFAGIKRIAQEYSVSLVVVGPEVPLALGIVDYLRQDQIPVFGPTRAGAQLEASKAWAKKFMGEAKIPTAETAVFTDAESAKAFVKTAPIVIKADGLAAGKGVTVAGSVEVARAAIDAIFAGEFGADNRTAVIEEYLTGQEVSVLALTDGQTVRPLIPAQDHKAIGEGDTGPNTGGMGAYAPTPIITDSLRERIQTEILEPALATLQKRGIDYRGVIYAGLMITPDGEPKVLEFNCRFGDPETQAVLALLETPLDELLLACCHGRLAELPPPAWKPGVAVCVVLASGGYPGPYRKGYAISGLEDAAAKGAVVFHAGTQLEGDRVVTDGGRVLGVTSAADTFEAAIAKTYEAVDCIRFEGMYCRRDIGFRIARPGAVQ